MKKCLTIVILSCGIFSLSFSSFAKETSVKSYYPAPNGKYTKIQLKSTANATSPTCASPGVPAGTIYTDPKTGLISICKSDGTTSSPMGACFNQYGESGTTPSCPANYVQNGTAENYSLAGKDLVSWICCLASQGTNVTPSPVKSGCFSTYSSSGQPALCSDIDKSAYDMGCETIKSNSDFSGITYKRNCCFNNTSGAIANGGYSACSPGGISPTTGSCQSDNDCMGGDPCKKYTCNNKGKPDSFCSNTLYDPKPICDASQASLYPAGSSYKDSCGLLNCSGSQCPPGQFLSLDGSKCIDPSLDPAAPKPCLTKACYDDWNHLCGTYTDQCGNSCTGTGTLPADPATLATIDCGTPVKDACQRVIGYGQLSCNAGPCPEGKCINEAKNGICGTIKCVCTPGILVNCLDNGAETTWTCNGINGGIPSPVCTLHDPVNGICGPASGTCSYGDPGPVGPDGTWVCNGQYEGNPSSRCSVSYVGVCGPASGTCSNGSASPVSPDGTWTCTVGSSSVSCGVSDVGVCGTDAGTCLNGTASTVTDDGTQKTWTCTSGGISSPECTAFDPVNGVCGTANGHQFPFGSSGYGTYLQCQAGTSTNTTFPGFGRTVYWNCLGMYGGGSSGLCSALHKPPASTPPSR